MSGRLYLHALNMTKRRLPNIFKRSLTTNYYQNYYYFTIQRVYIIHIIFNILGNNNEREFVLRRVEHMYDIFETSLRRQSVIILLNGRNYYYYYYLIH